MNAVEIVAELMTASAATAPKTRGLDYVETKIVKGQELEALAQAVEDFPRTPRTAYFGGNAQEIRACGALLLVGLKSSPPNGLDCGACGFADCKAMAKHGKVEGNFEGPICAFRLLDMGIALGSAVKTACMHNIDNRIMYSAGVAARRMGLVDWDIAMGVPLAVGAKNIFFDRK